MGWMTIIATCRSSKNIGLMCNWSWNIAWSVSPLLAYTEQEHQPHQAAVQTYCQWKMLQLSKIGLGFLLCLLLPPWAGSLQARRINSRTRHDHLLLLLHGHWWSSSLTIWTPIVSGTNTNQMYKEIRRKTKPCSYCSASHQTKIIIFARIW